MRPSRTSIFRLAVALSCFLAWTFATNPCALGLISDGPQKLPSCATEQACAGGCSEEEKSNDQGPNSPRCLEQCTGLRLALPATFKGLHLQATTFALRSEFPRNSVVAPRKVEPVRTHQWGNGPPEASSFAEMVLNESLFSTAPPRAR